jgi:hypothetical protein
MASECKVTARVNKEEYKVIQDTFYHGQQTLFVRSIFKSLLKLIEDGHFDKVTEYMYKQKPLTLPPVDKD